METFILDGRIDPMKAVDLRVQLIGATECPEPHVHIDLTGVTELHLAAIAALIAGSLNATRNNGTFVVIPPRDAAARRELDRTSWFDFEDERVAAA